jgi:hypothetical protein
MVQRRKASQAQIDEVVSLMEDTMKDVFPVCHHVLLETDMLNLDDAEVLSWFPAEFIDRALVYLRQEKKARGRGRCQVNALQGYDQACRWTTTFCVTLTLQEPSR